jgi:plastocyanin
MLVRTLVSVCAGAALMAAADIHGTITIERPLTHHNVTAPAGLYQRGAAVELGGDPLADPLAFERSHVAIYIEGKVPGDTEIAPGESKRIDQRIEQRDRRFVPDFVVITAGETVAFPNFDPIFHNVFSLSKAKNFDLGNYAKGDSRSVAFAAPGVVAVYCHLHPNMAASIVVAPNRFRVQGDRDGKFTLKNVPPGKYTLVAWHKAAGTFRKSLELSAAGGEVNFVLPYVDPGQGGESHVAHR